MGRPMMPTGGSTAALPHDLPARILDGSPDAILICDPTGIVRYWNSAAERVFGFGVSEALGFSMNLIIPERFRARHWEGWGATMRTGITRYGEGQLLAVPALHKDGRQLSIEFSIQLVKDADDQTVWVVAIIRDVTERFIREKDLRAQLRALQAKLTGQHQEATRLPHPLGHQRASDGSDPTVVQQVGTPTAMAGPDVMVVGD
jgi:PAS domain S-box-containing protein